ncbi:MAG: 2-C-methyl-D-erythritol 4-phosphate cytidylyltransferase [Lachnospiraceae bacterium]|nr:2-C-methyl-D-erythritol 4-phosphate cytidylyltransferase [Lachnospiraceae bacterium]
MVRHTAIILAAGRGSRMHSDTPKQFLLLADRPVLCYSLQVFQESFVDEIILVTGEGQEEYCREKIVGKYGFSKVTQIIRGGKERYDSVYRGLCASEGCDYVYIHDGARPFLDADILERARQCVEECGACAAGMPVKDTIRVVDEHKCSVSTPDRNHVWQMQTPQVFSYTLIRNAYDRLFAGGDMQGVTDDAMVAERMLSRPVRLFEGSYRNIKITTPEDILTAGILLKPQNKITSPPAN